MKSLSIEQIVACNDEQQLNEWLALAQGFEKVKSGNDVESELWKETFYDAKGNVTGHQTFRYLPMSSAEIGKSQCFSLMARLIDQYDLSVTKGDGFYRIVDSYGRLLIESKTLEATIVKASLCSIMSSKIKE